jgi:FimV-like protein
MKNVIYLTLLTLISPFIYAKSTVYGFARVGEPFMARLVLDVGLDSDDEFFRRPTDAERQIVLSNSDYWLTDLDVSRSPVDNRVYYLETRSNVRTEKFKVLLTEVSSYRRVIHEYSFDITGGENQLTSRFIELPAITDTESSSFSDGLDDAGTRVNESDAVSAELDQEDSATGVTASSTELPNQDNSDALVRENVLDRIETPALTVDEILLDDLTRRIAEYFSESEATQLGSPVEISTPSEEALREITPTYSPEEPRNSAETMETGDLAGFGRNSTSDTSNTSDTSDIVERNINLSRTLNSQNESERSDDGKNRFSEIDFELLAILSLIFMIASAAYFLGKRGVVLQRKENFNEEKSKQSEPREPTKNIRSETERDGTETPLGIILAAASKYERETNQAAWESITNNARYRKLEEDKSILLEAAIRMQNNSVSEFFTNSRLGEHNQNDNDNEKKGKMDLGLENASSIQNKDAERRSQVIAQSKLEREELSQKESVKNSARNSIINDVKDRKIDIKEGTTPPSVNQASEEKQEIQNKNNSRDIDNKNIGGAINPINIPKINTQSVQNVSEEITLAKVYLGMGETNSARSILENLQKNGSLEERAMATELLKTEFDDD